MNELKVNNEAVKKRNSYWDIIKGIGIISIVVGHTTTHTGLHILVYLYHLVIFYFVTTFFYNEKKYGESPFLYLGNKIKASWPKYFGYTTLLLLLHDFFVKNHFYHTGIKEFTMENQFYTKVLNACFFKCDELFAGALWFVPTIINTAFLFGGIVFLSRKLSMFTYNLFKLKLEKYLKYIKYLYIVLIGFVVAMFGFYLLKIQVRLDYYLHLSFIVTPICILAYFFREYIDFFKKLKKPVIMLLCFVISFLVLYIFARNRIIVELGSAIIINWYTFYFISIVGIIFCLSSGYIVEKIPFFRNIIELCGKNSFAIMALHFVVIKAIDVIYSSFIHESNPDIIGKWVSSYPEKLWICYVIVGCLVPVIISVLIEYIKKLIINFGGKINGKTN